MATGWLPARTNRVPRTSVAATKVKNPNPRRGSVKSVRSRPQKRSDRQQCRTTRITHAAAATTNNARDNPVRWLLPIATETMPVPITKAK